VAAAPAGEPAIPLRIALVAVQAGAGPDAVPLGAACIASALKASPDLSGLVDLRVFASKAVPRSCAVRVHARKGQVRLERLRAGGHR
jgi:hypothetical protein